MNKYIKSSSIKNVVAYNNSDCNLDAEYDSKNNMTTADDSDVESSWNESTALLAQEATPEKLPIKKEKGFIENGFTGYLQQVNKIPSLSADEELNLATRYSEQQDYKAAHKLITSHLKLVVKIALSYKNYGLPVTELVSEGNIGLMKAVKKFDPALGYRLSTYAMWWIKASIQEYVLKSWSLVKLGTTAAQKKLFFSLGKVKHKIRNLYSREVNEQDYDYIATELGVTSSEVSEMNNRLTNSDLSLHSPANNREDHDVELLEFIPETRPSPEALIANRQDSNGRMQLLSKALLILNERELNILQQRKLTEPQVTLKELSIKYSISEERVRQIENRAFEKVQAHIVSAASKSGILPLIAG